MSAASPTARSRSRTAARVCTPFADRWARTASPIWVPTRRTGLSAASGSWNTMAIRPPRTRARASSLIASTSSPPTSMRPEVCAPGGSKRSSESATVVLPLPDSPIRPNVPPRSRSNEIRSTGRKDPYAVFKRTDRSATLSTPARLPAFEGVSKSADLKESRRMQGQPRSAEIEQMTDTPLPTAGTDVPQLVGGRYRVLAPRGSGAEASVYLAVDLFTDKEVALKLGPPGRSEEHTSELPPRRDL